MRQGYINPCSCCWSFEARFLCSEFVRRVYPDRIWFLAIRRKNQQRRVRSAIARPYSLRSEEIGPEIRADKSALLIRWCFLDPFSGLGGFFSCKLFRFLLHCMKTSLATSSLAQPRIPSMFSSHSIPIYFLFFPPQINGQNVVGLKDKDVSKIIDEGGQISPSRSYQTSYTNTWSKSKFKSIGSRSRLVL